MHYWPRIHGDDVTATSSQPSRVIRTEAVLVEVPDVIGLSYGEADAQLRALGLQPEPSYQVNIEQPENTVFAQSPPAGQRIAEEGIVALTVSQGEIPRVPSVRGRNRVDAEELLRNAGFGVIVIEGPSQAEAGTVVFQEPASGTEITEGDLVVTITVSTGPGQIFVPDVRGQSPFDAIQTLIGQGFRVAERREPSSEVPEGEIIDTDPPHGFPVSAGLEVFIIISDGPQPASTGEHEESAIKSELRAAEADLEWFAFVDELLAAAEVDVVHEATRTEVWEAALQTRDGRALSEALSQAEDRVMQLRVHPNVFAQSAELLFDVILHYEQSWPWVRTAWDAAEVQFYDPRLPHGCDALACAVTGGPVGEPPQIWFTLDVLRSAPHRVEDVLLHELGHIWEDLWWRGFAGSAWEDARSRFHNHYLGCRRDGMSDERFRGELLADTMVMVTRGITYHRSGWHEGEFLWDDGYYDPQHHAYGDDFQYFDADGFLGCLVDGSGPPQHLRDAVREALG